MPATATETSVDLVTRFENNFNTYDVDALMADMTDDCVFEHVAPAAVSFGRHEGQAAVRAVWESLATHFPDYRFDIEDVFGAGTGAPAGGQWSGSCRTEGRARAGGWTSSGSGTGRSRRS